MDFNVGSWITAVLAGLGASSNGMQGVGGGLIEAAANNGYAITPGPGGTVQVTPIATTPPAPTVPTSGGGSPDLPPIVDLPPAPAAPTVPIVPGADLPSSGTPPTAGPSGPGGIAGPWIGTVPVALSSRGYLERELERLKRDLARSITGEKVRRATTTRASSATRAAASAARKLEQQVGQAVMRGAGVLLETLGAAGSAVVTGVAGVLYPSELGKGTLSPRQVREAERLTPIRVDAKRLPVPSTPQRQNVTPKPARPGGAKQRPVPTAPVPDGLEMIRVDASRLPQPTPPASSGPRARNASRTIQRAMSNPAARTALQALDLLSLSRQGRTPASPRSVPLVPVTPSVPTLTPATPPLTGLNPTVLSSPQTRTSSSRCNCNCQGKKRGKPRKCLRRGAVVWASGQNKGKVAGSKCLAFESR